ncbi:MULTISPECIES: TIR domain-containing protein [unclassified Priestia]|uniref:SLOG domain-containing protein n=1 Tax=unclassified Priestia TaxID=2800374 RepID=UPI00366FC633
MKAYLIHPDLTLGPNTIANNFFKVCRDELIESIEVLIINSEQVLVSARPTHHDVVVFFNKSDQDYSSGIINFLNDVIDGKSANQVRNDVIPIAIGKDMRIPPLVISQVQSFDLVDELRRRSLSSEYHPLIATSLARTVITRLQPTLSKDNMKLFISHRRLDGEEIAAAICKELRGRVDQVFRDLIDIRVGEDAQEVIESNLKASDAVIFLDTPKTGESEWIEKEIKMALSLNLPIIWIRIGSSEERVPLKTVPSGCPHFELLETISSENTVSTDIIDKVIDKAFYISREHAKCVFDQMRQLKMMAKENEIELIEKDPRHLIYQLSIPRKGFKYYQRPMTHLLQIFGRTPKETDIREFIPKIEQLGYNSHPVLGTIYDTPILLAPMSGQNCLENKNICLVDSFDEYIMAIQSINKASNSENNSTKGIIISGAFPDCEPDYQQSLTDAVHAFSEAILSKNGKIIFGAHPTFQHLILNMAKRMYPSNYKNLINLYISRYFVTEAVVNEYSNDMTVIATDVIQNDRKKSLSIMRKKMIEDPEAIALIALGGKTDVGGHLPGVDEEIELAKSLGIPVFVIGSVGGRTAQLSASYKNKGWIDVPNNLSDSENEELMISKDYRNIVNKILTHLNI